MTRFALALASLAGLALVLVGCGDGDDDQPAATVAPTSAASAVVSPTPRPAVTLPPGVSGEPQALPEAPITFETDGGTVEMTAEIADEGAAHGLGLMFRESLPEDHGMLFVFDSERGHSFFMRNTIIPLSLAYIRADGTISQIDDMEPLSEDSHPSVEPALYALEVNRGWFERNGVEVGDVMSFVGH